MSVMSVFVVCRRMEHVKPDWTYAGCSALTGATAAAAAVGSARIFTEYRITASRATSRSRSPALDCVKSVHRWRPGARKVTAGGRWNVDRAETINLTWTARNELCVVLSVETVSLKLFDIYPPSSASFTVSFRHFILPKFDPNRKAKTTVTIVNLTRQYW